MSIPPTSRRDAGFTLIEMIVSTLLFSLVMVAVVGVFLSTSSAERTVRSMTSATSAGQLVTRSMEEGLTNAAVPIQVTAIGGDALVLATTASKGTALGWSCSAWYYSADDGTIRSTSSAGAITGVTASSQRSWTLLADDVSAIGSTPVFGPAGTTDAVDVSFRVDGGQAGHVAFETTITSQTTVNGSAPCF